MSDEESVFTAAIKNFLSPISQLLEDEAVTEILINGPDEIFVEQKGKLHRVSAQFSSEDALRAAVNNIAQSVGRKINDDEPRLDARLPNGYRIHAVIPPCARNGTTVAIRKFSKVQLTFKDLIRFGALTVDAAQFLDISMKLGKNILVSGGTGSGKTTLLGILCGRIPPGQRVIVIEDASELSVDYEHVVFFETRHADENGDGAVSIEDLVRSSLRLRPDRIIVGEVRGGEALDLIQAMNTGHKGCLGTVHANTSADAIVRLEALAAGSDATIGEKVVQYQIGSGVDLIVQISRLSDGSRRLTEITEVLSRDEVNNVYKTQNIYELGRMIKLPDGQLKGDLSPTGIVPSYMDEIEDNKIPFPRQKFQVKSA